MTNQTSPPAGWYPDASDSGRSRWWDGANWQPEIPRHRSQLRSPLSWVAAGLLVVGFIPLVEGAPSLTLLLDLPALVLGVVATARPASRSWLSIVVLCLAAVGVLGNTIALSASGSEETYVRADIEAAILHDANEQPGVELSTVLCPVSPSFSAGDTFECIATRAGGSRSLIEVKVQDDAGSYTWSTK